MNNVDVLKKINEIKVGKSKMGRYIQTHFPILYKAILDNTSFLDERIGFNTPTFAERLYCIKNNITKPVVCHECGKPVGFMTDLKKYRSFCSISCSSKNKDVVLKKRTTHKKKTGYEHQSQEPEFGKKCLEKKISHFGIDNVSNQKKARETRMNKYDGHFSPSDFGEKMKRTKLKNNGDENWVNPQKALKTLRDKNNDQSLKCALFLPQAIESMKRAARIKSYNFIMNSNEVVPLFSLDEYIAGNSETLFKFKCKKCGNIFDSNWDDGLIKKPCSVCHPGLKGTSEAEKEIFEFVKNVVPENWIVLNKQRENRTLIYPHEIDIIVKNENSEIVLLIEYNGLYFHSIEIKPNKNYHLEKTEKCLSLGYSIIHIMENEWLSKSDIVKSRIKNMLGIYDDVVYARKCKVMEISQNETDLFMNENHIQGKVKSSVNLGLFYEGTLVSSMSFGKSRFNKKYEWELLRFCNKLGYHVIGGAGKLLKHFERTYNPKSLISYADRRWSRGNLYEKLGFDFVRNSRPNYWYFKIHTPTKVYNRLKFQKHRLKSILKKFDDSLTEQQNMRLNNYGIIFDCGNIVYCKIYNSDSATS